MTWDEMDYWQSGEWQVIQEKLDDLKVAGVSFNPAREDLFVALDSVPLEKVRVCILGQDPYPSARHATGFAFSIPEEIVDTDWPPTLVNLLQEYHNDLHYPIPSHGNLEKWAQQGVLLWNVIPSCQTGKPLSHDWYEWEFLTKEIIERLSEENIVFVALGGIARHYLKFIKQPESNRVIETSHPSPRGSVFGFIGSRIFSDANTKLRELTLEPINWRL